jgi:glycosyltransferase involved in cell wall biosynthesis
MIGAGEMEGEVRRKIATDPVLSRTAVLKGFIPNQDIPEYLNSADIYVLASHNENWGISIVEAMACGTVPVITNLPASQIISDGGKAGLLYPVGDKNALRDQLMKLAADARLRSELAEKAVKRAENFTWKESTRKVVELYERLLKERRKS